MKKAASLTLPQQILISMILGCVAGLFFGELCSSLEQVGIAFVMLLKMTVVPYMSCALIHSIGRLSISEAKKLLFIIIKFLAINSFIVIAVIQILSYALPAPNTPMHHSSTDSYSVESENLFELFIPINPFQALAQDSLPAIIAFSIVFGLAVMVTDKKQSLLQPLSIAIDALTMITSWVAKLSPIGVFALLASSTGTLTFPQFEKIRIYVLALAVGSILLALWIFPRLVSSFSSIKSKQYLNSIYPSLLLAFTTGNTLITLPLLIRDISQLFATTYDSDNLSVKSTLRSTVPIAYNLPTAGNLFVILFLFFAARFYALPIMTFDYIRITLMGMVVLFGSTSATLQGVTFLVDQLRLPVDCISLYIETMSVTRNLQGLVSASGIATLATLVALAYHQKIKLQVKQLVSTTISSISILCVACISIIYLFQTATSPQEPFTKFRINNPSTHVVQTEEKDTDNSTEKFTNALKRIENRGIIKVGYNSNAIPFAYFNQHKELVGFDISLAHDLAKTLGVSITFVPFQYNTLPEDLNDNKFDIAMSTITVTLPRIQKMSFTNTYLKEERVLVVKDFKRDQFTDLKFLKNSKKLRIAALKGTTLEELVPTLFPNATFVAITDYEQFLAPDIADALLWTESEALAWTQIHPEYTTLYPNESLGFETYAYAIHQDDHEFQQYLNYWLSLKTLDGFIDSQHDKWVLGKQPNTNKRWSIIRDVLHWIE